MHAHARTQQKPKLRPAQLHKLQRVGKQRDAACAKTLPCMRLARPSRSRVLTQSLPALLQPSLPVFLSDSRKWRAKRPARPS